MKRFLPLFLFTFLLTSCGAPSTSVPTAILIASATSVPTLFSTATPEPSPTPTKDPNVPAGYTKDASGNYTRVDAATGYTYVWDKEREAGYRLLYEGYSSDLSPDLNLPDENGKDTWSDGYNTIVHIDGAIVGESNLPILTHHDNNDSMGTINFTAFFNTLITEQMVKKGMIGKITDYEHAKFWLTHDYHIDFTNADGPQSFGLWDGSTVTVHIRNDAEALRANIETNGFSEAVSYSGYGPENSYMVKMWTVNGNLFIDIAPTHRPATEWTNMQIEEMIMFWVAVFDQGPDLSHPQSGGMLNEIVLNNKGKLILIDFVPQQ